MDNIEKPNFINHVFNFETDSKNEMVNIVQYCVLSIIFVTLLNRGIQLYMPDIDKDKGSLAIFFEILIQVVVIFIGILFIHRIITYMPTFTGTPYADQNIITTILPILVVMLSISKLGEKVSILADRIFNDHSKSAPVKLNSVQPISGGTPHTMPSNNPQLLPPGLNTSNPMATTSQEPDFNTMFSGPNTPLVNAQEPFEPVASNSFGGSIF
jgi:hypothetical protein